MMILFTGRSKAESLGVQSYGINSETYGSCAGHQICHMEWGEHRQHRRCLVCLLDVSFIFKYFFMAELCLR